METGRIIEIILFLSVLFSGFYAGTGFFIAMGGNPAIRLMSNRTFAEYWQITDYFMGARMKIFGPLLFLTLLLGVLVLFMENPRGSGWFMLIGLGILIADIIFIFSANHPLNRLVQNWDMDRLPHDVPYVKRQIVKAFNVRLVFMISAFVMVLLSVWFRKPG